MVIDAIKANLGDLYREYLAICRSNEFDSPSSWCPLATAPIGVHLNEICCYGVMEIAARCNLIPKFTQESEEASEIRKNLTRPIMQELLEGDFTLTLQRQLHERLSGMPEASDLDIPYPIFSQFRSFTRQICNDDTIRTIISMMLKVDPSHSFLNQNFMSAVESEPDMAWERMTKDRSLSSAFIGFNNFMLFADDLFNYLRYVKKEYPDAHDLLTAYFAPIFYRLDFFSKDVIPMVHRLSYWHGEVDLVSASESNQLGGVCLLELINNYQLSVVGKRAAPLITALEDLDNITKPPQNSGLQPSEETPISSSSSELALGAAEDINQLQETLRQRGQTM